MTANQDQLNSLTVNALMTNIDNDNGALSSPSSTISNASLQPSPKDSHQHLTKIVENTDIVDHTIKSFITNSVNNNQSNIDQSSMSAPEDSASTMNDSDMPTNDVDGDHDHDASAMTNDVEADHDHDHDHEASAMTDHDDTDMPSASHSPKSHLSHATNYSEVDAFSLEGDHDHNPVENDPTDDTAPIVNNNHSGSPHASKPQLTVEIPGRSALLPVDSHDQLDSEPLSGTTPAAEVHHIPAHLIGEPHNVWLTPAQARSESKKLKGYRWIPVEPQNSAASVLASRMVHEKRERKERKPEDDHPSSISSPSIGPAPTVKREKSSAGSGSRKSTAASDSASTPTAPARKSTSQFQEPVPRAQSKKIAPADSAQIRALELRLEALKRQQKLLRAQSGGDSHDDDETTEDDEEVVRNKKRKSSAVSRKSGGGEKRHKTEGASPVSGSATAAQSPSINPLSSPSLTSVSKRGRNIRTPSQFVQTEITLTGELKRCKTLLDHLMAYKPASGIFNEPVNYLNPGEPYFATGYLEVIGGPAMDLGTIKGRLTEGMYSTMNDFAEDVRIVWRNAQRYNQESDWIHTTAKEMSSLFESELTKITEAVQREEDRKLKRMVERSEKAAAGILAPSTPAASENDYPMHEFDFDSNPPAASPQAYPSIPRRPAINRQSSAASSPALSRASSASSAANSKITGLTQREKHILKDDIFRLPPHRLGSVLEIIGKDPHHAHVIPADDDEVEIDIDNLQISTLRQLQEFVKQTLAAKRKSSSASASSPAAAESNTPRASPSNAGLTSPHQMPGSPELDHMPGSPHTRKVDPRSKYDDSSDDDSEEPAHDSVK